METHERFIRCTNDLMACLSEHDLKALLALYQPRQAQAKQEVDQNHERGKQDGLTATSRLYDEICFALEHEMKRRNI